ncbi:uncharacterized protein LOC112691541 [Sipha flava]|uniref:Uncharacterized protein LOC112691541 n=1 Tax=Sipha flava TaxID=143950 RepID=A0A8B8GG63_9HEMI|nr:uncharacterized protein LOC112691541 [Sipha flava]
MSLVVQITQVVGLYVYSNDFQRFAFLSVFVVDSLMCLFKGYALLVNADRLYSGLELGAYAFTLCGRRDTSWMRRRKPLLSGLLRMYAAVSYITLTIWLLAPLVVGGHVSLTRLDGTVATQRANIFNMWAPVSDATYNSTPVWSLFYAIEIIFCIVDVTIWVCFDCYAMTMCYMLIAQFDAMTAEYETLGRLVPDAEKNEPIPDHYDELICSIKDNQKIIE